MNLYKVKSLFIIFGLLVSLSYGIVSKASIQILAAENIYGEVAKELGGSYVQVTSILTNLTQDPHLFTVSPSTARVISNADIIVYNGVAYDPWINPLLILHQPSHKPVMVVAELMNIKNGSNPHIWYLPETMPMYAKNLVAALIQIDPLHKDYFQAQLNHFNRRYMVLFRKIEKLRQRFKDMPVIATEPVFNYMINKLGMRMHGQDFQLSMMNGIPPTISQMKEFEEILHQHAVQVLIFNNQVVDPTTQRMYLIAKSEGIPVVGINEMMPGQRTYVQWVMEELIQLEKALEKNEK